MFKNLLSTLMLLALVTNFMTAQSIGIIGSSTPVGWDEDTDMTQDAMNSDLWTINLDLITGAAKFRQDDAWDVNWGSADFPLGVGTQGGDDIPVPGGNWDVTFNTATGDYTFTSTDTPYPAIGIIGDSTPGGWDSDTDMVQNTAVPTVWTIEIELIEGAAKFRANDDWVESWGSMDFPTGIGALGGDNIAVPAGNYIVTFNTATGYYNFESLITTYSTIGLIGDSTPGGWDTDTDMMQSPTDPAQWSGNIILMDGEAKFRAEDDWAVSWGAEGFPTDTAVIDGPNIPVVAGEYNVTFNTTTGIYEFGSPLAIFNTIGILGTATPNGFDSDIDMFQDPINPDQWSIEIALTAGELKFRAEDDWAVNWGGTGFPTGTGTQGGDNIVIPFADNYEISFNATTGEYILSPGVTWGMIGPASPTGNWDEDIDMETLSNDIGNEWSSAFTVTDGEGKFRKNDDWAVNFGAPEFPIGLGTQDGTNIMVLAGDYFVSLNTATGDYAFEIVENTTSVLNTKSVKVFPNPATDLLNINIEAKELQGEVTLVIMDMTGKIVRSEKANATATFALDIAGLNTGMYILQMSNDKFMVGKKFTVTK
ncbi:MAG: hypothetical protein ACJAVF_002724 [Paraglaciecola sp.]|jgi:hypothetical protein